MTPLPFLVDFGLLPPEINSARMYSGPGSAPLLVAATAWKGLATELRSTAQSHRSIIAELMDQWHGPASASMAAAAAPYAGWLSTTAAQAEQAFAQATAAVTAYEAAFAATVPPPVIAANRAQLMALVATNVLGQNTAAIAATEAHYAEMWAQDAAVMYCYAADSAAASVVTPFMPPPPTTNPAAQADAVAPAAGTSTAAGPQAALSQLQSAVPTALQALAVPGSSAWSPTSGLLDWLGLGGADFSSPRGILNFLAGADDSPLGALQNNTLMNTMLSSGFYMPGNYLGTMTDFAGMTGAGGAAAEDAAAGAESVEGGLASAVSPLGPTGLGGAASAGLGQASAVGALSVPYGWTTAAPEIKLAAAALPSSGLGAVPAAAAEAGGSLASEAALASMAGLAMRGPGSNGRAMGATASPDRPLPIVIVKPPPSPAEATV